MMEFTDYDEYLKTVNQWVRDGSNIISFAQSSWGEVCELRGKNDDLEILTYYHNAEDIQYPELQVATPIVAPVEKPINLQVESLSMTKEQIKAEVKAAHTANRNRFLIELALFIPLGIIALVIAHSIYFSNVATTTGLVAMTLQLLVVYLIALVLAGLVTLGISRLIYLKKPSTPANSEIYKVIVWPWVQENVDGKIVNFVHLIPGEKGEIVNIRKSDGSLVPATIQLQKDYAVEIVGGFEEALVVTEEPVSKTEEPIEVTAVETF